MSRRCLKDVQYPSPKEVPTWLQDHIKRLQLDKPPVKDFAANMVDGVWRTLCGYKQGYKIELQIYDDSTKVWCIILESLPLNMDTMRLTSTGRIEEFANATIRIHRNILKELVLYPQFTQVMYRWEQLPKSFSYEIWLVFEDKERKE